MHWSWILKSCTRCHAVRPEIATFFSATIAVLSVGLNLFGTMRVERSKAAMQREVGQSIQLLRATQLPAKYFAHPLMLRWSASERACSNGRSSVLSLPGNLPFSACPPPGLETLACAQWVLPASVHATMQRIKFAFLSSDWSCSLTFT